MEVWDHYRCYYLFHGFFWTVRRLFYSFQLSFTMCLSILHHIYLWHSLWSFSFYQTYRPPHLRSHLHDNYSSTFNEDEGLGYHSCRPLNPINHRSHHFGRHRMALSQDLDPCPSRHRHSLYNFLLDTHSEVSAMHLQQLHFWQLEDLCSHDY